LNNNIYAAIDLGSNSFHMLVVQNIAGTPRTIAKVKRKVRLASGLDHNNYLDDAAMNRGWQCLALFAERLSNIPPQNIKIVSTATLRLAKNANVFCAKANDILGLPIDIISGEQEAALIYHGMAVTSDSADKRMIVDIGGASTELILGQGFKPLVLNSLNIGCVTWLERYFNDGLLNQVNFTRAMDGASEVIELVKQDYLAHRWQLSLGASGSIQAVQEVLVAQGLNEEITLAKLNQVLQQTMGRQKLQKLNLVGLKEERKLVFASGLAILITLFKQLNIERMISSGGALREGLIDQLFNQAVPQDIRANCCEQLQQRFQLDSIHACQVAKTAIYLARQLTSPTLKPQDIELLGYAGLLHEVGTSVEFLAANRHGHYILSHCAMAGFSKQQRKFIAAVVGNYKCTLAIELLSEQAWCSPQDALSLTSCLRLAVIINGGGQDHRRDDISLHSVADKIIVSTTAKFLDQNPLLNAELEQEVALNNLLNLNSV